ncbi:hypothetical protein CapIbe_013439 [Capra ibex]
MRDDVFARRQPARLGEEEARRVRDAGVWEEARQAGSRTQAPRASPPAELFQFDVNLHARKGTPPVQRVGISVQKTGNVAETGFLWTRTSEPRVAVLFRLETFSPSPAASLLCRAPSAGI